MGLFKKALIKRPDPDLTSAVTAMRRLELLTDKLEGTTAKLEKLVRAMKAEEEEVCVEEVNHGDT